jgi:hypothetical protein
MPVRLPYFQMRYANNSNYKNDTMIKKEAFVGPAVLAELKRIIDDSEVSRVGSCLTRLAGSTSFLVHGAAA